MQFDSKIFTEQIIFHPGREKERECDIERERECDIDRKREECDIEESE